MKIKDFIKHLKRIYVNGFVESAKVIPRGDWLEVVFVSNERNVYGELQIKSDLGSVIPEEFTVFDLKSFISNLKVIENEENVEISIDSPQDEFSSRMLNFVTPTFKVPIRLQQANYKVPRIKQEVLDSLQSVELKIDKQFIKSINSASVGMNSDELIFIGVANNHVHFVISKKIDEYEHFKISIPCDFDGTFLPMPFSLKYFRNILKNNNKYESINLRIYEKFLIDLHVSGEDFSLKIMIIQESVV